MYKLKLIVIYCQLKLLDDGPDKLRLLCMFRRQKNIYEREFTQVINSLIQGIYG